MASTIILTVFCVFTISASGLAESSVKKFSIANTHVIGGTNVTGRLPYQISLRVSKLPNDSRFLRHFCGGSLITPYIVLTAAHCLNEEYSDYLRTGALYAVAGTNFLHFKAETAFVSLVIAASKYPTYIAEKGGNINDVALLKLEKPAPITDGKNIGLIPLRKSPVLPNEKCVISGWGTVEFGRPEPTEYLQQATVPIVALNECQSKYQKADAKVTLDMICAGLQEGGVDSCQGDSGGPLVCNKELTGVTSWGFKCALSSFPGVYASVPYHKTWIEETISDFKNGITITINDFPFPVPTDGPISGNVKLTDHVILILVCVLLTKL